MPEYNEELYLEKSNELITDIEAGVEGLREAGLDDDEIKSEINTALENCKIEGKIL